MKSVQRTRLWFGGLVTSVMMFSMLFPGSANAQLYDWYRTYDCGSGRAPYLVLNIVDPGAADLHSIFNGSTDFGDVRGFVNRSFRLSLTVNNVGINVGGTGASQAYIVENNTRIECRA